MFHRVKHERNFTMIDNGFLRNESLSMKARGLLATILSLPDNWSFSIRGLEAILPDGRTAIEGAVRELEAAGYIVRHDQGRGADGRMLPAEWDIYERPYPDARAARDPPAVESQREEHSGSAVERTGGKSRSVPVTGFPYTASEPNKEPNN